MHSRQEKLEAMGRLLDIMQALREKCPWNRAQTTESLRPMTLEEVYELSDAVLHEDYEALSKELGDVLLHIVFYSRIAEEEGRFDFADVAEKVSDKMVYRHPHVFSDTEVSDADDVSKNWEMLKTKEKGGNRRVLSGVPDSLPSILKAFFMQDKTHGVGFDWQEKEGVWEKVDEEMGEFRRALVNMGDSPDEAAKDKAEMELGDLLFTIVNASRLYGLDPDTALNRSCDKFRRRFTYIEEQTIRKGKLLSGMSLREMDALWEEAKQKGL